MLRGEVAITGGSLGGLTSCYAASKYPDIFERAVCSSPSNCFNFGSGGLAAVINSNYLSTGKRSKAVVQFLGVEALSGDGVIDGDEYQMEYLMKDDKAWQSIGMKPLTAATLYTSAGSASHAYTHLAPLPDNIIASLLLPAGQHAPSTWEQEFAAALPFLYRADRPDKSRIPKSEQLTYLSAPAPAAYDYPESDDTFSLSAGEVAACVVVPSTFILAMMVGYLHFVIRPELLRLRLSEQGNLRLNSVETKKNPMH